MNTTIIVCVLLFIIYYIFFVVDFDIKTFWTNYNITNSELVNKNTADLINANTLPNLPFINVVTNNTEINEIRKCINNPVYLGDGPITDALYSSCFGYCGNSADIITVDETSEYYYNSIKLSIGNWCVIDPPVCNPKTSMVVATIQGNTCQSKYPQLFDSTGFKTIACNSTEINNVKNKLWDNLNNIEVDPLEISINNQDELLPDGSYRFTCKFDYDPVTQNKIIPHPLNRFIPALDNCTSSIFAAHPAVHAEFITDDNNYPIGYTCDCGEVNETRVTNVDGTPKSKCSSCILSSTNNSATVPISCFTTSSTILTAQSGRPCGDQKFTNSNVYCDTANINITKTNGATIDTSKGVYPLSAMPLYNEFQGEYTIKNSNAINNIIVF